MKGREKGGGLQKGQETKDLDPAVHSERTNLMNEREEGGGLQNFRFPYYEYRDMSWLKTRSQFRMFTFGCSIPRIYILLLYPLPFSCPKFDKE